MQPLVATRSLPEMLSTTVSRATTDNTYAASASLDLPTSPYVDPPLDAVVAAATRATAHVAHLLSRKADSHRWPISEFAIAAKPETRTEDGRDRDLVYVLGAARPAGGELTPSTLYTEAQGQVDGITRLRSLVGSDAGLPVDWTKCSTPSLSPTVRRLIDVATLPLPVPPEIVNTFSDDVLAGKLAAGARALGQEEAWARVEMLDAYLGVGVLPSDLRFRLAEALVNGVMIRGAPPPWRTLVRHAVLKKLSVEVGPVGTRPLVVHFIAAYGQQRLADGGLVPGLLEAEKFHAVSLLFNGAKVSMV